MRWHIGQRVVCITDGLIIDERVIRFASQKKPVAGMVYTIRGFNISTPEVPLDGTGCGFYLEEIVNQKLMYSDGIEREISFDQAAFRSVKETNIGVFLKMLEPRKASA